uniref:cytochrome c oxidase subunit II n=1 Tax=Coccus hesperidum TaxID=538890 RepID=UPI002E789D4C|nr:cytochrome c oxidase subunit II [Coccus hesperidum]WRH36478.1 cytochrome c oxidase subunit II [Coccus hesperidum]
MNKNLMYSFKFNESTSMMNMNKLNDKMLMIMMMIIMSIMVVMMTKKSMLNKSMNENHIMETMWTIFPSFIILIMSAISIPILYTNNEMKMTSITIKIMGNQWFWSYEYTNFDIKFNSYMMYKKKFNFNILETDNKMVIPFNTPLMLIMSSMDVIHSWCMPSLNIKMDSIPGQMNSIKTKSNKIGVSWGQCSEICGTNHSFMPVMMETVTMKEFIKWVNKNK